MIEPCEMLALEIVVFLTGRPILQEIVFNYRFRIFYVSNTLPISCICTLFFSQLLVLIYLCVDDFYVYLYICCYQWDFPFVIFLFLVMGFSFPSREVPLKYLL